MAKKKVKKQYQVYNKNMRNTNDNFEKLIKKDIYQIFIFSCALPFPFNFARHPWFVINKKGEILRYEVMHSIDKNTHSHLNINNFLPTEGIPIYFLKNKIKYTKLMTFIEGDENSILPKIVQFIENSEETYLYCNKYSFFSPNSNTYAQNILNEFPEFNIKLSWRFFGKDFMENK